jgi:integral membrane sensor domain MASE1
VAKFALVAAPLGCAVSALTGVFSLYFFGDLPAGMVLRGLWVGWLGELLGVYLIAPCWQRHAGFADQQGARLEGLVLVLGMLATW